MANIKSAIKRNRQNEKLRVANKGVRSQMRTEIKELHQRLIDWHKETNAPMPTPNKGEAGAPAAKKTGKGKGK